jgi:hypothetical protein
MLCWLLVTDAWKSVFNYLPFDPADLSLPQHQGEDLKYLKLLANVTSS